MTIEQARYQVRFDWGTEGSAAIASDAHVIVWADALGDEPVPLESLPPQAAVVRATLQNARAVADWVVALQLELNLRMATAVVAAGSRRADGTLRPAVEDLFAAGAVIDRLSELGLDATSPEAAAAQSAYAGLRNATGHLITASVTATALPERPAAGLGRIDPALTAAEIEAVRPYSA